MKISVNDIKPGHVLLHQDALWLVVKTSHVKPGKGGAFLQTELKNVEDGRKLNERFRAADRVERVRLEQRAHQFLYRDGGQLVFMDTESFDQRELTPDIVGERALFLQEGMQVTVESHEERIIGVRLPAQIDVRIAEADAVVKGQTQSSSYKPAALENGVKIMVPPFVCAGETVTIDTDTLEYIRRAETG